MSGIGNLWATPIQLRTTTKNVNNIIRGDLGDLNNLNIGTATTDDVIKYDGSLWVNGKVEDANVSNAAAINASKISSGIVNNTEFDYLDGLTGNIQSQIDGLTAGELVAVSATDTTPGFLNAELTTTSKLSKTILNPGADEQLELDLNANLTDLNNVNTSGEAQGDILYRNATEWVNLGAGTSGDVLTTNGAGANPSWNTPTYEATTATNVGTAGVGIFRDKTGDQLNFKKINAGSSKITITDDVGNDEVDVDIGTLNLVDLNTKVLNNLTDVNHGTLSVSTDGRVLQYDNGTSNWIDRRVSLNRFKSFGVGISATIDPWDWAAFNPTTANVVCTLPDGVGERVGDSVLILINSSSGGRTFTIDPGASNDISLYDNFSLAQPTLIFTCNYTNHYAGVQMFISLVDDKIQGTKNRWRIISYSPCELENSSFWEESITAKPVANDLIQYNASGKWEQVSTLASSQIPANVVYTGDAQTLTNKTMDWNNNTFQNFPFQSVGENRLMPNSVIATLSTNQDNYSPAGLATANKLVIDATTNIDITGIDSSVFTAADGVVLSICSVGSGDIKLKMEDTGSTAANRFKIKADVNIEAAEAVIIVYVGGSVNRWQVLSHI